MEKAEHYIYYPSTQYHVLLSLIIRDRKKIHQHSIILDEEIFSDIFINKVINKSNWSHVYVVKRYSKLLNYYYRYIYYKFKYYDLFNIRNANIVIFTFSNNFANFVVNSLCNSNNVLMGEDGIFPYYDMDIAREYYLMLVDEPPINKIKRLIMYKFNSKTRFMEKIIKYFLLFNPEWLPVEFVERYKIEHVKIDHNAIRVVFEELNILYDYKSKMVFGNIDVVFFDSDHCLIGATTENKEFDLLCGIFMQLRGMNIYIKLRPNKDDNINAKRVAFFEKIQKKTSCDFVVEKPESIYPWELVYYNNSRELKDVIFIGLSFSTAFITANKFHGLENNIICLKNMFLNAISELKSNKAIDNLIGRINNTYQNKYIYTPVTYREIHDIARSISKKALR